MAHDTTQGTTRGTTRTMAWPRHTLWGLAAAGWLVQVALPFTQRGPLAASTPWEAARFAASGTMPMSVPWWIAPGLLALPAVAVVLLVCHLVRGAHAGVVTCALLGTVCAIGLVRGLGGPDNLALGGRLVAISAIACVVGMVDMALNSVRGTSRRTTEQPRSQQ